MNRLREHWGLYTVPRIRDGSWAEIDSNLDYASRNLGIATFFVEFYLVTLIVHFVLLVLKG